ncbi:MAG: DNA replication/repair protein RecF [candidate division Zixibacteria bacterium]|nr:DNA replication/repair protein RecF [candidate division Zixibacteria bacterium]
MHIHSLRISNFRNFHNLDVDFSDGINIFFGSNGSGKTNLLEALFTLCLGRSQRGAVDSVLVRQTEDVYRLQGELEAQERRHDVAVAYQRGGRKKITIDGSNVKIAELFDSFCAVASGPEDSEILSGPPSSRRLFLDIYLSQLSRKYLNDLTDYYRALAQKNAALKNQMDPSPFEPLLVSYGSRVMALRSSALRTLKMLASDYYSRISGGEKMMLRYDSSVAIDEDEESLDRIETAFQLRLDDYCAKERILKNSLVGPHRDDITFEIADKPARTHGSQGQWRTAAISLKLGIYHLLKEKRRVTPILLLDEIFAELDTSRATALMQEFGEFKQLFLTTAIEPPREMGERGQRYRIDSGRIEQRVKV